MATHAAARALPAAPRLLVARRLPAMNVQPRGLCQGSYGARPVVALVLVIVICRPICPTAAPFRVTALADPI